MSALDEKTRAERALRDLQKGQGEDKVMWTFAAICSVTTEQLTLLWVHFLLQLPVKAQDISSLEDTVAALKEDYERCLSASAASQKDLQENLVSSKHQLLRVQEQLALAEKVRPLNQPPRVIRQISSYTSCVHICRSWRRSSSRPQPTATWRRSWPRRTSRSRNWGNSCRGGFASAFGSPMSRLFNREILFAFQIRAEWMSGSQRREDERAPRWLDGKTTPTLSANGQWPSRMLLFFSSGFGRSSITLPSISMQILSLSGLKRPCPFVWLTHFPEAVWSIRCDI